MKLKHIKALILFTMIFLLFSVQEVFQMAPPEPFLMIDGKEYRQEALDVTEQGDVIAVTESRGIGCSRVETYGNYLDDNTEIWRWGSYNPEFRVCAQHENGSIVGYQRIDPIAKGTDLNDYFRIKDKVVSISVFSLNGLRKLVLEKEEIEVLTAMLLEAEVGGADSDQQKEFYKTSILFHLNDDTQVYTSYENGAFYFGYSDFMGMPLLVKQEFIDTLLRYDMQNFKRRVLRQAQGGGFFGCQNKHDYTGEQMDFYDMIVGENGSLQEGGITGMTFEESGASEIQVVDNQAWYLKDGDVYQLTRDCSSDEYHDAKKNEDEDQLRSFITKEMIRQGDYTNLRVALDQIFIDGNTQISLNSLEEALITLNKNGEMQNAKFSVEGVKFFEVDNTDILYVTKKGLYKTPIKQLAPELLFEGKVVAIAPLNYGAAYSTTKGTFVFRYEDRSIIKIANFAAINMLTDQDSYLYLLEEGGNLYRYGDRGELQEIKKGVSRFWIENTRPYVFGVEGEGYI